MSLELADDNIIQQVHQDSLDNPENNKETERSEGSARGENLEKSDGLEQLKNSLAGFLRHVGIMLKGAKACLVDSKHNELETALKSLNSAWEKYDNCYSVYVMKNLPEEEVDHIKKYSETQPDWLDCVKAISECLFRLKNQENTKGKSKRSFTSSRQSKLREIRKSIETKKLLLQQQQELAQYELEMENRKIEMELERKRKACEMKFQIQLAEMEAELLEEVGSDAASKSTLEDKKELPLLPPVTQLEKISHWAANYDEKPLNPEAPDFTPSKCPLKDSTSSLMSKKLPTKNKNTPERKCAGSLAGLPPVDLTKSNDTTAVLLKLTMLQAMQPKKFSGNPSVYPTFRDRLRNNLEDGILTDSQKLQSLPKFLAGEAFEVIERVSGCSYDVVLDVLHTRYGQPAMVAAACIENLTRGQKLSSSDSTGLLNFAEQLESAAKKLSGEYELEASTMTNLRQIVKQLPNYLVNKWGDASFAIREKGSTPRLSDLAKFVKRQAAIKNDPGFINEKEAQETN